MALLQGLGGGSAPSSSGSSGGGSHYSGTVSSGGSHYSGTIPSSGSHYSGTIPSGGSVSPPSNPQPGSDSAHAITHTQRGGSTTSTQPGSASSSTPAANNSTIDTTGMYKLYDPNGSAWGGSGGGSPGGSSGGGSGGGSAAPAEPEKTPEEKEAEQEEKAQEELDRHWKEASETTQGFVDKATLDPVEINRVDHIDTEALRNMLQEIVDLQKQQSEQKTDYAVERGVNELTRALEDAQTQFDTERNQIAADEARAKDNQALYAEARGDRGGIGQAQYDSVQNTAATNRMKVNQAQTKLATDTNRQIADLRAQGEFEKADALLSITQSYLSELKSLEQWALQTNLSVDEFNVAVDEWEAEFNRNAQQFLINTELSAAQVTGAFANGTPTLAAQEQLREQLANTGQIMLDMGLTPTPAQIEAMGLTNEQYEAYKKKMESSGGSGGGWVDDVWGYGGSYYNYHGGGGSGSNDKPSGGSPKSSPDSSGLRAAYSAGSGSGSAGGTTVSSSSGGSHSSGKF